MRSTSSEFVGMHFIQSQAFPVLSQSDFDAADLQAIMWLLQRHKQSRIVVITTVQIVLQVYFLSVRQSKQFVLYRPYQKQHILAR